MNNSKFIAVSTLFIILSLFLFACGNRQADKPYIASFRSDITEPEIDKKGGREAIKERLAIEDDFSNLSLKVDFANASGGIDFDNSSFELLHGKGNSMIIVDVPASWSKNGKKKNENMVIWGSVTGILYSQELGNSPVTISFLEIPAENIYHFNLLINANYDHPPIFLSFGNFNGDQEVRDLIIP